MDEIPHQACGFGLFFQWQCSNNVYEDVPVTKVPKKWGFLEMCVVSSPTPNLLPNLQ